MSATSKTSESPRLPARSSEDVVREWIARFATNCGQPLSNARVVLWLDELADIEPARLEAGFRRLLHSHRFNNIPQIGDIRRQIDDIESRALDLEAEASWQRVLRYAETGGCFIGPATTGELSPLEKKAAEYAGGLGLIAGCPFDRLPFVKKSYTDALKFLEETGHVKNLLAEGEAKELLRELSTRAEDVDFRKELVPCQDEDAIAAAGAEPAKPADVHAIRSEFAALRATAGALEPRPAMTEAEFCARKELLDRQAEQIRQRSA
jgi:hypothetical protein